MKNWSGEGGQDGVVVVTKKVGEQGIKGIPCPQASNNYRSSTSSWLSYTRTSCAC